MSLELRKKVEQLSLVQSPHKVRVLILGEQKSLYSDFYFLSRFSNLIKLDLSYNKIVTFPTGFSLKKFSSLKILFLHYNKFSSFKSLQPIVQGKTLQYLTLFGNPLQQAKTRHFMLNEIPTLKIMDERIVNMQQRNSQISFNIEQQSHIIKFPIVTVLNSEASQSFLSGVIQQLSLIRKKYLDANPIIRIQRWFRFNLKRKRATKIQIQQQGQRLVTAIEQKRERQKLRQRLITQKMLISKSSQQKIASIFKMNFQFYAFLKEKAQGSLYAEFTFCQENNIRYEKNCDEIFCLKNDHRANFEGKYFLPLVMKISQMYLLRKKGSGNAKNYQKQFQIYQKFLNKKAYKYEQLCPKTKKALQKIEQRYKNRLVKITQTPQIKFHLLKQSYKKLKSESINIQTIHKYFPFCLGEILQRTIASVAIQRVWRGYKVRKTNNSCKKLAQIYSATKIQKWIRKMGLQNRCRFWMDLRGYLKKNREKKLTLQVSDISNLIQKRQKNSIGINFILQDQNFHYKLNSQNNFFLCQTNKNKMIIPQYFNQLIEYQYEQIQQSQNLQIPNILFRNAKQILYWQRNKIKYVTFIYQNLKQARTRKFLLALITYQFRNHTYLRDLDLTNTKSSICLHNNINQHFFVALNDRFENNNYLQNRQYFPYKFKLFMSNRDLSGNGFVFLPKGSIKQAVISRRQSIRIENQSILQYKSLGQSSQCLHSQFDQSNNHRVGLKMNPGKIHNKIIDLQEALTGENRVSDQNRGYQVNHNYRNFDQRITQIAREDGYCDSIHQQIDSSLNNYDYQRHRVMNREETLRSLYLSEIKQKKLQKSQSLNPKTKLLDISIDTSIENKRQAIRSYRRDFNTELESSDRIFPKTHRYEQYEQENKVNKNKNKVHLQSNNSYNELLRIQRNQRIKQLKELHKLKLSQNLDKKQKYLKQLKKQIKEDSKKNRTLISNNNLQYETQKKEKTNRIKAYFDKNKQQSSRYSPEKDLDYKSINSLVSKSPRSHFESQFVTKGNKSIKLDMLKFQKVREYELISLHNTRNILKSSRKMVSQKSIPSNEKVQRNKEVKQSRKINNKKDGFKTQIKQFSINLDEPHNNDFSLGNLDFSKQSSQAAQRVRMQTGRQREHYQKNMKRKQKIFNYNFNLNSDTQQQIEQEKTEKKSRKNQLKKIVHSVFPQQFYPLKQAKQLGFQLPKLKNN